MQCSWRLLSSQHDCNTHYYPITMQLMLKDLRLAMQLASATKTPAPMIQSVSQLYRVVSS